MVLTYESGDPVNAAAALRDIELRCRAHGAARAATALFHNAKGEPYTHHQLHIMLRAAIAHIYGKAAASLYSWHSYRSGLATALHAAGVDDAMIQLICRWMCPESLHVYRRMGVAEHERLIKGAALADVDLIQSTNAPKVFADQGYAELVGNLAGARGTAEQQAYEEALKTAMDPYRRETEGQVPPTPGRARQARKQPGSGTANRADNAAEPQQSPGGQVSESLQTGTPVAVLRATWPRYACKEMAGKAWHATVVARTAGAAKVRFTNNCARDGRRYEDVCLPLGALRLIA